MDKKLIAVMAAIVISVLCGNALAEAVEDLQIVADKLILQDRMILDDRIAVRDGAKCVDGIKANCAGGVESNRCQEFMFTGICFETMSRCSKPAASVTKKWVSEKIAEAMTAFDEKWVIVKRELQEKDNSLGEENKVILHKLDELALQIPPIKKDVEALKKDVEALKADRHEKGGEFSPIAKVSMIATSGPNVVTGGVGIQYETGKSRTQATVGLGTGFSGKNPATSGEVSSEAKIGENFLVGGAAFFAKDGFTDYGQWAFGAGPKMTARLKKGEQVRGKGKKMPVNLELSLSGGPAGYTTYKKGPVNQTTGDRVSKLQTRIGGYFMLSVGIGF